jgi:hypothetical protein
VHSNIKDQRDNIGNDSDPPQPRTAPVNILASFPRIGIDAMPTRKLRFACDSPLEGDGFEPLVPGESRGSRQVDILQILAGRLSSDPTVGRCGDVRFRAPVKGSMAWLLCLPVGQASSLASSCCSTLFFDSPGLRRVFRRGTNGSNPVPSSSESGANYRVGTAITGRPRPDPDSPD